MIVLDVDPRRGGPALAVHLRSALAALAPRSIVRLRLAAPPSGDAIEVLRAASLRALAPAGMEVSVGSGRWTTTAPRIRVERAGSRAIELSAERAQDLEDVRPSKMGGCEPSAHGISGSLPLQLQ